jgi:flagellar protein FliO/FliZ
MSLGVILLAGPAPAKAFAEPEHPLNLRHDSGALEPSGSTGGIWKLALLGVAVGAGVWFFRRKAKTIAPTPHDIRIVSRASIGVRVELVVVEVEGQRMLVGVTPSSVQRIASLGDEPRADEAIAHAPEPDIGERFGALIEGTRTVTIRKRERDEAVEAQARGLLDLVKR